MILAFSLRHCAECIVLYFELLGTVSDTAGKMRDSDLLFFDAGTLHGIHFVLLSLFGV